MAVLGNKTLSHLLRMRRGAGTPACRVDTRVDPLTGSPQNAEMSLGAADTSVRATSVAAKLFLRACLELDPHGLQSHIHAGFGTQLYGLRVG